MNLKASIFLFSAAAIVAGTAQAASFTTEAAPLGITYQPLGRPQGYGMQRMDPNPVPRAEVVFANEKGLTTYTYDKDEPGKSNCTGECASTWIPVVPVAKAK